MSPVIYLLNHPTPGSLIGSVSWREVGSHRGHLVMLFENTHEWELTTNAAVHTLEMSRAVTEQFAAVLTRAELNARASVGAPPDTSSQPPRPLVFAHPETTLCELPAGSPWLELSSNASEHELLIHPLFVERWRHELWQALVERRFWYGAADVALPHRVAEALRMEGLDISVDESGTHLTDTTAAIPHLLRLLQRNATAESKIPFVDALATPLARPVAAPVLISELRRASDVQLAWHIAEALTVVADDSVLDDILALIRVRTTGALRTLLVRALANMRASSVASVLTDLLQDDALTGHVVRTLGALRVQSARAAIEGCLSDRRAWVRAAAARALRKLDAARGVTD